MIDDTRYSTRYEFVLVPGTTNCPDKRRPCQHDQDKTQSRLQKLFCCGFVLLYIYSHILVESIKFGKAYCYKIQSPAKQRNIVEIGKNTLSIMVNFNLLQLITEDITCSSNNINCNTSHDQIMTIDIVNDNAKSHESDFTSNCVPPLCSYHRDEQRKRNTRTLRPLEQQLDDTSTNDTNNNDNNSATTVVDASTIKYPYSRSIVRHSSIYHNVCTSTINCTKQQDYTKYLLHNQKCYVNDTTFNNSSNNTSIQHHQVVSTKHLCNSTGYSSAQARREWFQKRWNDHHDEVILDKLSLLTKTLKLSCDYDHPPIKPERMLSA
jgi:hypothetical protein